MSLIVVQIAILFLPGLIWAHIDRKYASYRAYNNTELFLKAFLFGLSAYSVIFLLYSMMGLEFSATVVEPKSDGAIDLVDFYDEILLSLPVALSLSILWTYDATYKLFFKIPSSDSRN